MEHAGATRPCETPAIFVASLTDYVNGVLHGSWLDARLPPGVLLQHVHHLLEASPTTKRTGEPAEEWVILDHEGFHGTKIDPHEPLEEVHRLATHQAVGAEGLEPPTPCL